MQVLAARPGQAEAQLSFAALSDLLETVDPALLSMLPLPQRDALDVALLRATPAGRPPETRALGAALLHVIRTLANRDPLLLAIDDAQWLDSPSADVLSFAVRRFRSERVGILITERSRSHSRLSRVLQQSTLERVEVGPLSFGASRRLLVDRLGLDLPRREMRRVFDATRGNPLFVLELGRTLVEGGLRSPDDELPLPDNVEELLGIRVARLPEPVRRVLLAVALSADLRWSQAVAIVNAVAVDEAVDDGLLVVDGDRLRASHPLLAAAVRRHARARDRATMHRDLSEFVTEDGSKLRHLALATTRPDEGLAKRVSGAATAAAARGARTDAVELAAHALRLTPPSSASRAERLLSLGECLDRAGELSRLQTLLGPEVQRMPPGGVRARAHLLLLGGSPSEEAFEANLAGALVESADDPATRARALAERALDTAVSHVERLREAGDWATEALSIGGGSVESLSAVGWVRILRGCPIDDLVEREAASRGTPAEVFYSLDRLVGIRLAFRGEVARARAAFTRLLSLADERGEAWSYLAIQAQMTELELRAGEIEAARSLLGERESWSDDHGVGVLAAVPRRHAHLAVAAGFPREALDWADEASRQSERNGNRWDPLEVHRARGIAWLALGDPGRAADELRSVWYHTQREGVDDPGAFPAAPDLVEALVALGETSEAAVVTERLGELAHDQEHPWGLATAKRCRAMVRLASDPADGEAFAALTEAASAYLELGLRFDHGRSLLILGRAQRRARRWGDARRSLEQAQAAFDGMGAPGWADQARSELDRVGARRPAAAGTLTAAEERVVELAAEGRSNKEIAHALSIGVHTVEVQLSRAYAKLGVQSRAQLARRLAARPTP
jgi:DNA-binding CsgD family transcriptional regulator